MAAPKAGWQPLAWLILEPRPGSGLAHALQLSWGTGGSEKGAGGEVENRNSSLTWTMERVQS